MAQQPTGLASLDEDKMRLIQDLEIEMMTDMYSKLSTACQKKCIQPKYRDNDGAPGGAPEGAGDAMAPPDFGRTVNPISTKGGRLCTPNNTGTTPGFSDLPMALRKAELLKSESVCIDRCVRINIWTFMKVLAKS